MNGIPHDAEKVTPRRVRRPKDKEKLLTRLVDEKVFETYRDALAFAAALGYSKTSRLAFQQTSEPIAWSVFSGAGHEALVNLLAVMSTQDFDILSAERFDERLMMFEEFANGGLHAIEELLERADRQSLDVILDLVMESEGPPEKRGELAIEKFASDLSW